MPLKLSDGHTITLADHWTHDMEKAFDLALFRDGPTVTAEGVYRAWEAVFPMVIAKVQKGAQEVPYSLDWLGKLFEKDYKALRAAVDAIDADAESAGEKNPPRP